MNKTLDAEVKSYFLHIHEIPAELAFEENIKFDTVDMLQFAKKFYISMRDKPKHHTL